MLEPYHDQRIVMRIVSWSPCYCFWVCVLSLHYRRAEPETRVYIRLLESLKALKDTRGGSPMDWKCKSLLRWAEVPSKPKPAQTLFDMRTAGVGYYYLGDLFHWLSTSCLDLHQNCYAHSTHAYLTKFKQLWEDEWWGENCSVVTADTEVPILRVKAFPARGPLLISILNGLVWGGQNTYAYYFIFKPMFQSGIIFVISYSNVWKPNYKIVCFNTEKYTSKSMHEKNVMAVRKLASVLLTKTSCQTASAQLNNLDSFCSL